MFFSLSSTTSTRSPAMTDLPVGQCEDEPAPLPELALDPDPAAVELDETLREREPETRAFALPDADFRLLELLEDPPLVLAGDPGTGVGDRDEHLLVDALRCDDDAAALRSELDRVREEVEDDLTHRSEERRV